MRTTCRDSMIGIVCMELGSKLGGLEPQITQFTRTNLNVVIFALKLSLEPLDIILLSFDKSFFSLIFCNSYGLSAKKIVDAYRLLPFDKISHLLALEPRSWC